MVMVYIKCEFRPCGRYRADMDVPFPPQTRGSSRLNITNELNLITCMSSKRQIYPRFQNQRKAKPKPQKSTGVLVSDLGVMGLHEDE